MKLRFIIYALAVILMILAVVFARHRVRGGADTEAASAMQAGEKVSATSAPAPSANATQAAPRNAPVPARARTAGILPKADDDREKWEEYRRDVEASNVPLDFHGRAIDQDSNGLSGVVVRVNVRHWAVAIPGEPPPDLAQYRFERRSGPDGRFEINGVTGDAFDLESITKPGYEAEPTRRGFGATEGTIDIPVIFRMWDTNIHERLITGHRAFHVVPDGRGYLIDLSNGTIAESGPGDLRVWIKCPDNMVRGAMYEWSCEIDAIDGGLLEEPAGIAMYIAPGEGYRPSFQFRGQVKGGQDGSPGEKYFYVELKDGQEYGAIAIEPCAPYNRQIPGLIRLSYAINPSGSRILR